MTRRNMTVVCIAAMAAVVLAPFVLHAQEAGKGGIVIPGIAFSGQGDGNNTVKKVAASRTSGPLAEGYVHFWYTPGHWLEWTFDAPATGEYQLSLHYATKYKVQRGLAVNGQPVAALKSSETAGAFSLAPTGRWIDWKDVTLPGSAVLKQGKNVLRMTCLDDCSMLMSEIRLTAQGKEPVVLKAPRFSGQGGGTVQVLTPPSLGYLRGWMRKGHWLEWNVEAPAAGEYDVYLHYATDDLCSRGLQVNGQTAKGLESFALPSTGDDRNWTEARLPAAVTLKKGANALRLTSLGGETEVGLSAIRLVSPPAKAAPLDAFQPQPADARKAPRANYNAAAFDPASLGPALPALDGQAVLKAGQEFALAGRKAKITTLDALPYVANTFSSRFVYEPFGNPLLRRLREQYKLDEVIAPGKDEFEKQLLLMEWAYNQWDFGHGRERYDLVDPFEILQYARREHHFQCMHSSAVFQAAANSLGWVCRKMAIPQHTFNEMWSNQYQRWVMFDATSNYSPERAGVPLNTFELRQGLLYEDGNGVVSLRHKDGQLTRTPKDAKYGKRLLFLGYIPNTNSLQSGPDYGKMFIIKDKLCEGKSWHTRECPKDPATEPYFPIGQAALALVADGDSVKVTIGTMTPNFKEFQVRIDGGSTQGSPQGGAWKASPEKLTWSLHAGQNTLEARSVNKFGVEGPVSKVVLTVE